jgi:Zn-dependent oligopeptidase
MTSEASLQVELDSALSTIFTQAEKNLGFRFQPVATEHAGQKAYEVKDAASEKLIGVVTLDPFTSRSTSCSSNSAEDHTVSVISVSMNLQKPAEGTNPVLNAQELHALFKLSGHAFSALAAKKHLSGVRVQRDIVELKPSV